MNRGIVPPRVLAAIWRGYRSATTTLLVSSEMVERLGRAARKWNEEHPHAAVRLTWKDMAYKALTDWLARNERSRWSVAVAGPAEAPAETGPPVDSRSSSGFSGD